MRYAKRSHIFHPSDKQQPGLNKRATTPKWSHGSLGKQLQQLSTLYEEAMEMYDQSSIAKTVEDMLKTKNRPHITKVVSLGLGSLLDAKDQQRRIKQLVLLLQIASHLDLPSGDKRRLRLYAQDPTFTATDETFLESLGICILKTPSISELGEAGRVLDQDTLIYSPFLTLETYKMLLGSSSQYGRVPILMSDDFDALKSKWDKGTVERKVVQGLIQGTRVANYRRRAMNGEGFWTEADRPFPMALYWRQSPARDIPGARSAVPPTRPGVFHKTEQQPVPVYT
ncbi:hypothetical protein F66182_2846 [Fusarium sp. NRRL 66182]|nr:hypothetical protein F66182_2846 [Fusarium sp. NRRL 66182]